MKVTNTSYYCDKCKKEIDAWEYENIAITIRITVDLPNPKGGCGEASGIKMKLCSECSKELGINNTQEYHETIYSSNVLLRKIKECKNKILELFKIEML